MFATIRTMASQFSTLVLAVVQASEEGGDKPIYPWFIGGGVLAFLLFLVIALVWFGGGRDHS